jgi:peroxiredoxin Q/BCP
MPSTPPEAGQIAPDFTLPRDGGGTLTLSALRPMKVVVYFYPKDDTPGCTLEARDFTALRANFEAAGTMVLGISKDSVKAHDKFCQKYDLSIPLLSDESGTTCEDYGVWVEKNMYGKTYFGVARTTFLIDGSGKIAQVWTKVKAQGHAEEVFAVARRL